MASAAAYHGGKRGGGGGLQLLQQQQQQHGVNMNMMMMVVKKRVVVMVDHSSRAKHAMVWALSHVLNKGDLLTLLHVVAAPHGHSREQRRRHTAESSLADQKQQLVRSLGRHCKTYQPEVEVEVVVVQGPKLLTVLSQVKKLHASLLILGQKDPSPLSCLYGRSREEAFVEECVNRASCLTLAVRRQSGGLGGYLVSTRWQKNFWLLA